MGSEYGRKGFGNVAIVSATLDFVTSAIEASNLTGSFAPRVTAVWLL